MPVCQGRCTGPGLDSPCPDRRNDDTVCFGQGDLWLCKTCLDARFPCVMPAADAVMAATSRPTEVKNELLYFTQNKCHVLSVDNIASICADFYTCAELEAARVLLADCSGKRLTRHKGGSEKERRERTAVDIVKMCVDPNVSLPVFYSTNMARIPPVGVEHIDVSALVQEVAALRAEVRSFAAARAEVADIRATLSAVQAVSSSAPTSIICTTSSQAVQDVTVISSSANATVQPTAPSFAALASSLQSTGMSEKPRAKPVNKPVRAKPKPVVGRRSSDESRVKSVVTKRSIDLFVTRLDPDTIASDVTSCVTDVMQGDYSDSISCSKLTSKFEEHYSSFHVAVTVDSADVKRVVTLLNAADSWPEGVLVRRYFKPKNNG